MKKVLLSAGHSSTAPGVCANGLREADVVQEMRDLLGKELEQRGVTVIYDRNLRDKNLPLKTAIQLIRGTTVAIELHCNSGGGTGVETLFADNPLGRRLIPLAMALTSAVAIPSGLTRRIYSHAHVGAKPDTGSAHKILGFCRGGGLVLELFFLDNKADLVKFQTAKAEIVSSLAKTIGVI